jgi:transcriptional regulator with XRE-family HTH domain
MDIMHKTLSEARDARGWSQSYLADALGVSVAMVSLIENGKRQPTNAQVFLLATLFGVRVAEAAAWFGNETKQAA